MIVFYFSIVHKFETTGSVLDNLAGNVGRPITARTPENIAAATRLLDDQPGTSVREAARELGGSVASTWRMMRIDLNLFPYKMQIQQQLSPDDVSRRLDCGNLILEKIDASVLDVKRLWVSDEANFYLSGYVNKQNWRHWGSENPHLSASKTLKPQKIMVWCAISADGIIGPIFIDGNVNSQKYLEILQTNFFPEARRRHLVRGYFFQQDLSSSHK